MQKPLVHFRGEACARPPMLCVKWREQYTYVYTEHTNRFSKMTDDDIGCLQFEPKIERKAADFIRTLGICATLITIL